MPNSKKPKHLRDQKHGRPSTFKMKEVAKDLHELLDIPLQRYGKGGSGDWYEPTKGRQIISAIAQIMREALLRGETVSIQNFGRFRVITKPAHRSRIFLYTGGKTTNIQQTPEAIEFPAKKVVRFYPSRRLQAVTNLTRGFRPSVKDRKALSKEEKNNVNKQFRKTKALCK